MGVSDHDMGHALWPQGPLQGFDVRVERGSRIDHGDIAMCPTM